MVRWRPCDLRITGAPIRCTSVTHCERLPRAGAAPLAAPHRAGHHGRHRRWPITETHYFDAKREVGPSSGDRKELGRDLASFAIDGGALLIGLAELKEERNWRLAPQPLEGLAERVEQIATQLVDPPLFVQVTDIPSARDAGVGYLFVEVPPSARAPHMLDGIYFGRGDRTRIRLSDAEVVRHHSARESVENLGHRLLDVEVARDPAGPDAKHACGRLYGVAQPLTAPSGAGRMLVSKSQQVTSALVREVDQFVPDDLRGAAPTLGHLSQFSRRAQGVAWSSYETSGPGRTLRAHRDSEPPDEEAMLDVELREDGGLRLLLGRLTAVWGHSSQGQADVVFDALAVAYALRLALWAAAIGDAIGYRGSWLLGVHGTDLRGAGSFHHRQSLGGWTHPFDAEDYREVTTATRLELLQQPGSVAERLVGRLTRALGTEDRYAGVFQHERLDRMTTVQDRSP
jgi:hypothetical protein